ncbi:MAG: bifunctional (p)ppGpp synthetase/guanosine-3',5'-bis(diphosphate) 3'-pyrophosphohydrolase [Pseudomonadota bacterium]
MDGDAARIAELTATAAPAKSTGRFLRQYELVDKVKAYHPDADENLLNAGYVFAVAKHGEQVRASGDPYFSHPVSVAGLLADLKLDEHTIIAGLLHDTVEDTDASLDEIEDLFGPEVRVLVDGVTKLSEIDYSSRASKQANNFQKFILATTGDVRVLLVKLADRLHNMRTLHFIKKPEKRQRIAWETMDLYAPLAGRIGLYEVQSELEDLAFAQINPTARDMILEELNNLSLANAENIGRVEEDLSVLLEGIGLQGRIQGRRKQPYSIWRKLERKSISFREVADIFAFRVIIDNTEDCYRVLGAAHQRWKCLQDRFRDFISRPKPNGYRSLHTTVLGSGNRMVELQIRTEEMHETAEKGVAAHWGYKNNNYGFDKESAARVGLDPEASLQAFSELIENSADPDEFLEHAKLEMYRDHVFAFTPNGRLIVLRQGAMPLDFAYAVHTAIGETCIGVKINGEPRSLRRQLENGDVVEIIRSSASAIVSGWEALTVTAKAKSAIRRLVRAREEAEFETLGRRLTEHVLRRDGIDPVTINMAEIAGRADFESAEVLYQALGRGRFKTSELVELAFPGSADKAAKTGERLSLNDDTAPLLVSGDELTSGVSLHMGQCCCPLPGDRIIGVQTLEKGLVVHTSHCGALADFDDQGHEWVDLKWTELARTDAVAVGRVHVTAANRQGVMATLCSAVAEANANITRIDTGERRGDFIEIYLDIEVEDLKRLTQILAALRSLAVVDAAERLVES